MIFYNALYIIYVMYTYIIIVRNYNKFYIVMIFSNSSKKIRMFHPSFPGVLQIIALNQYPHWSKQQRICLTCFDKIIVKKINNAATCLANISYYGLTNKRSPRISLCVILSNANCLSKPFSCCQTTTETNKIIDVLIRIDVSDVVFPQIGQNNRITTMENYMV